MAGWQNQDEVPIPTMAQDPVEGIDYECELVIIIGKPGRDIPESKALDYVLGYSVGNDISHREWQIKKGGGQWYGLWHCNSGLVLTATQEFG